MTDLNGGHSWVWRSIAQKLSHNFTSKNLTVIGTGVAISLLPAALALTYKTLFKNQDKKPVIVELLDLPVEVREQIWSLVKRRDLKNLRLTCRQVMEDIDYVLGVNGILDEESPGNLEWIQSVRLQNLYVLNFFTEMNELSLLRLPYILQSLHVLPQPLISPDNLKILFHGAVNVRELTLYCSTLWEYKRLSPEVAIRLVDKNRKFSDVILEGIQQSHALVDLSIILPPFALGYTTCHLEMEQSGYKDKEYFDNQVVPGSRYYTQKLRMIRIVAPFLDIESLDQWKILFDLQTSLECFICYLGTVHWTLYSTVLKNCYRTLKVIVLQDVQSFRPGALFDWSILSKCPCLEDLHFLGRFEPHDGIRGSARFLESINFSCLNLRNLREITLMFVQLTVTEFERIFNSEQAPNLERINILFFRPELGNFPVFEIIFNALGDGTSTKIQTVHIGDEYERFFHPLELRGQAFRDRMLMIVWKYTYVTRFCQNYKYKTEFQNPWIFPIMQFKKKPQVEGDQQGPEFVEIAFPG